MNKKELETIATENGYFNLRWLKLNEEEVLCGLLRFAFTFGLVVGIDEVGYQYRYCYPNAMEAILSINELKEVPSNPEEMTGNWIKCKGLGYDLSNKNYK